MIVDTRRPPEPPRCPGMGFHAHAPASVSIGRAIMTWLGSAHGHGDEHETDGSGKPCHEPRWGLSSAPKSSRGLPCQHRGHRGVATTDSATSLGQAPGRGATRHPHAGSGGPRDLDQPGSRETAAVRVGIGTSGSPEAEPLNPPRRLRCTNGSWTAVPSSDDAWRHQQAPAGTIAAHTAPDAD